MKSARPRFSAWSDEVGQAQVLGVVGYHEEIKRTVQFDPPAEMAGDLLPPGDAVGVVGAQGRAHHSRVGRPGGVEVGVSKEDPVRKTLLHVRRVFSFGRLKPFLWRVDVLRQNLASQRESHQ